MATDDSGPATPSQESFALTAKYYTLTVAEANDLACAIDALRAADRAEGRAETIANRSATIAAQAEEIARLREALTRTPKQEPRRDR